MLLRVLAKVFRNPAYDVIAFVVTLGMFVFSVWLPNLKLIAHIVTSDYPLSLKINLPISLLGSISTNFTTLSATYTIAISILFGIDTALVSFFLRHRITEIKQSGIATGFLGIVSGLLGVGCIACGTFVLTNIFVWLGVGGIIQTLPLGGDLGILGVILLAISIYLTAKHVDDPMVCNI
jgi:hypothetical protein